MTRSWPRSTPARHDGTPDRQRPAVSWRSYAKPTIGLEVWGNDYQQIFDTAVAAEELGFGAFYYGESPHPLNLETWTVLAGVAARTATIRLGPVIANLLPGYRSFPLLVRQLHTLAVISNGRVDLRTGTGAATRWAAQWWLPIGVDYPERAERRALLDEWLEALHVVWSSTRSGFRGERLRFDEIRLEPPVERPRVTVAAMGPKSMSVAAARADVWEASHVFPDHYRVLGRQLDGLSHQRHRRVIRALEIDVVTAPTEARRRRLEQTFLSERGPDGPAALAKALTGPADLMATKMRAYLDAGAERFLAACVDPHDTGSLEVLAQAAALVGCPEVGG
jgi:alkanesulfonate monooxygenase SsuD/methylene tetrahydromethanopterin reductase-like flavin-dependent oxidoreductase (luciferase family)